MKPIRNRTARAAAVALVAGSLALAGCADNGKSETKDNSKSQKDAAEQSKKYIIGVDSNQNWVKPGYVLTSMVKRVDNAVYQIIADLVAGKFQGGIHVYGLEDGGIGYAMDQYNEKLVSPAVLAEVEAAKARIIRGEIKVTDAMAQ